MEYIKKKYPDKRTLAPFPGKYNIIDLSRMLTYPRPAGSEMEEKYIAKFIDIVPGMRKDPFGNRIIRIGKKPTTLFSSHTDTVHDNPYQYGWVRDETTGVFKQKQFHPTQRHQNVIMKGKWLKGTGKDILGADDTTGNWLMLNLISEKKPGLYIFHRQEEEGRTGSEWIAKHRPKMLKGIKRAIAFDRKGYEDIITHQAGSRTASDKFAKELGRRLGSGFKPDPTGSFTDTLSYAHIIPECTNISIGYKDAHFADERQNLRFARHLYTRIRDVDFETLPTARKPTPRKINMSWLNYDYTYGNYQFAEEYQNKIVLTPKQQQSQQSLEKMESDVTEYERKRELEESNRQSVKKLFNELPFDDENFGPKEKKKKEGYY